MTAKVVNEEFEVLKEVTQRLERSRIPYMVTGSVALQTYAVPRMTRDIDVVVEIKENDVGKLLELFEKDYYIDAESIKEAVREKSMFNVIHNTHLVKVDLIVRKESEYREVEFARRQRTKVGDLNIWVVSPEDLLISKLWWAKDSLSSLQLGDAEKLLKEATNMDLTYAERWIKVLGLQDLYLRVKR